MKKFRGRRQKKRPPPFIRQLKFTKKRNKLGRFSRRGKTEQYISVYRLAKGQLTLSGKQRYERLSTVRLRPKGHLTEFYRNENHIGLHINKALEKNKIFKKFIDFKPKGFLVKVKGRIRGKKKDTTKLIRVFLDTKQKMNKTYLTSLLTGKILTGLRAAGVRVSERNKRNQEFDYLRKASIEIDYY